MVIIKNEPGNIAVGQLNNDLLANIKSLSRDDAVGALVGLIDHAKFALVNIIENPLNTGETFKLIIPYNAVILKMQLFVAVTGTSGNSELDLAVDGTDVAANPVVSIPNTDADLAAKMSGVLDIAITKDSILSVTYTQATGGGAGFAIMWLQRVGRLGNIGI